ncbi:dienelactone hydrolase family protein [bacterium]|nr:dienelactone hydrolase family protein [bacterium]
MRTTIDRLVHIEGKGIRLEGMLGVPENAIGVVLFAHGSGSSRLSPRNQFVANYLRGEGLATLLIDLLEPEEAEDRSKVFDIALLADRLKMATDWLQKNDSTADLQIGYFGASTGAAAALMAAADKPEIGAVVSRGGRPDLALEFLSQVKSPTLLIVGGMDVPVIQMNRQAYELLGGQKQMVIVPGATHLFEEAGALEEVARLAAEWFGRYLESD